MNLELLGIFVRGASSAEAPNSANVSQKNEIENGGAPNHTRPYRPDAPGFL